MKVWIASYGDPFRSKFFTGTGDEFTIRCRDPFAHSYWAFCVRIAARAFLVVAKGVKFGHKAKETARKFFRSEKTLANGVDFSASLPKMYGHFKHGLASFTGWRAAIDGNSAA